MLSDEKFHERTQPIALFKNTEGAFSTIEEYKEKIKDLQTDKHDKLVHIYSSNKDEQFSYIKSAKDKGYDVKLIKYVDRDVTKENILMIASLKSQKKKT